MINTITEELKSISAFRVDAEDYDWFSYPDVIFEIILDAAPTNEQTAIALFAMSEFVSKYNKWHFLRPIHYIGNITDVVRIKHPRGIYIHIDFGNCPARALVPAVKALEKTNLPIFRVTLQW